MLEIAKLRGLIIKGIHWYENTFVLLVSLGFSTINRDYKGELDDVFTKR